MSEPKYIYFGGQKQKISDLQPNFKAQLIQMGILKADEVEQKPTERKTVTPKVRSSPRIRERTIYIPVPTKEPVRSKDSGADIIAKCVGRSLGRLYGRFKYG